MPRCGGEGFFGMVLVLYVFLDDPPCFETSTCNTTLPSNNLGCFAESEVLLNGQELASFSAVLHGFLA